MQDRVDAFALAAEDWHGAHNDAERAARGPFGVTVGHAHLGSSVRMSADIVDVVDLGGGEQLTVDRLVEIDGEDRPACAAQALSRHDHVKGPD